MDGAADVAPDEIKEDFEFMVEQSRELVAALKAVDFDFDAVDQSLFDDPETNAAGQRIEVYGESECGIESEFDTVDTVDTVG